VAISGAVWGGHRGSLGCYQAPARVKELRDKFNFSIETELVTLYDQEGYEHPRAARYHLNEVAVKSGVSK
jgi:hypothetical protein